MFTLLCYFPFFQCTKSANESLICPSEKLNSDTKVNSNTCTRPLAVMCPPTSPHLGKRKLYVIQLKEKRGTLCLFCSSAGVISHIFLLGEA